MSIPSSVAGQRRRYASRLLGRIADHLLPQDCALCGGRSGSGSEAVCAGCLSELTPHGPGCCPRCGDASAGGETCGHCLKHPPAIAATIAAFVYAFPLDRLVQRLKYGGQLHLARWWAARLVDALRSPHAEPAPTFDLILPMPLHPSRLTERGFNQAVEIGRPLAAAVGLPLSVDACTRTRATPPQAELERAQRLRNVRGAFECRIDLSGRNVLLLDDVMTTGASIGELARVLRLHGAATVTALIGARTLHH